MTAPTRTLRRLPALLTGTALAVVLTGALAACGGSDDDPTATTTGPGTATTSTPAGTGSGTPEASASSIPTSASPSATPGAPTTVMTMPGNPDVPVIPGTAEAFTGSWRDPDGGAVVTFADDGTLTGTDGCNNFRSTWTLDSGDGGDGSVITVDPFPTTMMACTGGWSPWILSMHTVTHHGDHLTVTNEGDTDLGELIPAVPA